MAVTSSELQYIADSLLIEKLYAMEFGIQKQAGILDTLGGAASAIKDQVKSHLSSEHAGGIGGGVIDLLAPAMLFRLNPIVGILYLIGTQFGLDITSVATKIVNYLKPKILQHMPITMDEINSIGKKVMSEEVGPITAMGEGYTSDMLEHLREVNFTKFAAPDPLASLKEMLNMQGKGPQTIPHVPWIFGSGSPIQKLFGELFESRRTGKAKWLLGGFVIWIIKTVLAGAGLLAVAGAVSGAMLHKAPSDSSIPAAPSLDNSEHSTEYSNEPPTPVNLPAIEFKSSGRGEQIFPNDDQHLWIVPLVNGSVSDTLLAWAIDVYPDLQNQANVLESSGPFQKMVQLLENNHRSNSPNSIAIPKPFSSRKQIVDLFVQHFQHV